MGVRLIPADTLGRIAVGNPCRFGSRKSPTYGREIPSQYMWMNRWASGSPDQIIPQTFTAGSFGGKTKGQKEIFP